MEEYILFLSEIINMVPPARCPSGIVLNHQSRSASYQILYKNGTSSAHVLHWLFKKENTGSFSIIKIGK